jgi:hypothetical protein
VEFGTQKNHKLVYIVFYGTLYLNLTQYIPGFGEKFSETFLSCEIVRMEVKRRDSALGMATGYWLDIQGNGVRIPIRFRISLLHIVQTGSGAHPASYPMGTGCDFPGIKAAGTLMSR